MKEYTITWEIQVTADDPLEAVKYVFDKYFRQDHTATNFMVKTPEGYEITFDFNPE